MIISAPVWAVTYQPPFSEAIQKLADWGAGGIELIGLNEQTFIDYYTDMTILELKTIIKDQGMILSNFNYSPGNLVSEDVGLRQNDMATFARAAETAKKLGAKHITSVAPYPFSLNDAIPWQKQLPLCQTYTFNADLNRNWAGNYALYVEQVERCCEIAAGLNLDYLVEPHPYRYVNSAVSMLYLLSRVHATNLKINFDSGHMFASGDMPQCGIYQLQGYIGHFHIGDNDTYTNAHWRPGMGKIDWYSVLKAMKDTGYDYAISMELSDVPGFASRSAKGTDAFGEQFRMSAKYLMEIGTALGIRFNSDFGR